MKKCILTIACALSVLACSGADLQTLEEVMTFSKESVAEIETWSADVETVMNMEGISMVSTGTMQTNGKRSVTDMQTDMMGQAMKSRTIVGSDGIQWSEMEVMGQTQVMKMDMSYLEELGAEMAGISMPTPGGSLGGVQDPTQMLQAYGDMYDLKFEGSEKVNDENVYVITGTLKSEIMNEVDAPGMGAQMRDMMGTIKFTIGAKDGFTRSVEMIGPDGKPVMTMRYKNIVLNQPMDDSLFEYTPPAGVEIMDMNAIMEENMEAFAEDSAAADEAIQ